jgi:hypothetical protein
MHLPATIAPDRQPAAAHSGTEAAAVAAAAEDTQRREASHGGSAGTATHEEAGADRSSSNINRG